MHQLVNILLSTAPASAVIIAGIWAVLTRRHVMRRCRNREQIRRDVCKYLVKKGLVIPDSEVQHMYPAWYHETDNMRWMSYPPLERHKIESYQVVLDEYDRVERIVPYCDFRRVWTLENPTYISGKVK